jgi:hypothetical protein
VAGLGRALGLGRRGKRDELMAHVAAYAGLRQGELFALTAGQIAPGTRVITVDRKLVEVAGHLYVEAPRCRKFRTTIYPVTTPDGYPLAAKLAARTGQARAERQARRPGPRPPRHPITPPGRAGHAKHPGTQGRHSHVPRKGKGNESPGSKAPGLERSLPV